VAKFWTSAVESRPCRSASPPRAPGPVERSAAALADVDRLLGESRAPDLALLPSVAHATCRRSTTSISPRSPSRSTDRRRRRCRSSREACVRARGAAHRTGRIALLQRVRRLRRDGRGSRTTASGALVPGDMGHAGRRGRRAFELRGVRITIAICFDVHTLAADAGASCARPTCCSFERVGRRRGRLAQRAPPEVARASTSRS